MGDLLRLPRPSRSEPTEPRRAPEPEPLWREAVGDQLRRRRHGRRETLGDVAERAGISTQYLSEVERGLKDPSSELLSAVAGALDLTLIDLTAAVTRRLATQRIAGPASRGREPLALAA